MTARLHPLPTLLGIALCAVICGADSWVEIEEYGKAKQEWLGRWLPLPHGIPSHDTFARVFARLQPQALGGCLQNLTCLLVNCLEKQVAIDGKYLRHSFDTEAQQGSLVMLNAWASCQRLALASLPIDLKSNEIKAVPELLALLDIAGGTVTLDRGEAENRNCWSCSPPKNAHNCNPGDLAPPYRWAWHDGPRGSQRTHTGKQVLAWLEAHPRFVLAHPPVHCSWMNQIEQWFSILVRKRLRIADFANKQPLAERLRAFITEWNERAPVSEANDVGALLAASKGAGG